MNVNMDSIFRFLLGFIHKRRLHNFIFLYRPYLPLYPFFLLNM